MAGIGLADPAGRTVSLLLEREEISWSTWDSAIGAGAESVKLRHITHSTLLGPAYQFDYIAPISEGSKEPCG